MSILVYDLHVHTNYSDGLSSPSEVVKNAINRKINGIAITDHDSIDGIEEAINESKKENNIEIIPGIELGCIYKDEEVHILGLFIDYKDEEIIYQTKKLKEGRITRGIEMVKLINALGMDLTIEDVQEFSRDNYIGRPHVARALVKKNYVSNLQEAFNRYLERGKPAYAERYTLSIEDAIMLIERLGGISSLAHPGLLKNTAIIDYCISKGINGLECVHSKHTKLQTKSFRKIAKKNKLLVTGGSDCHGELTNGELLLGQFHIDEIEMDKIKEML